MNHPTAAELQIASCSLCNKTSPIHVKYCPRCGSLLHLRKPRSLQRTWAFLITAILLYIPANTMPIMVIEEFGLSQGSTIFEGIKIFWKTKSYAVAIIIFTASVVIPILKILCLIWLCLAADGKVKPHPHHMGRLYHLTEILGRWSMVDVFVVVILVCLVQLGILLNIDAGPAALSFALVVILTMLSAMSFDPRLIWDQYRQQSTAIRSTDSND